MEKTREVLLLHDSGRGQQWSAISGVYGTRDTIIFKKDGTSLPVPDDTSVLIRYRLSRAKISDLQDSLKCRTLHSHPDQKPILWRDHTVELSNE